MARPITTLFMLMSVDGKISLGATDNLDFDKDLPHIAEVKEGLQQYYHVEQTTELWLLNSGRVQAKIGANEKELPAKTPDWLSDLGVLELESVQPLEESYIRLRYKVIS